ncbi:MULTISPECIES: choline ABC transporter ATP-binding protein [Salinivibrio]|uniref:Choline ABC transporter ATP-binding protein n=1 Tax=Salinivibrio kushneri TaxID=1908198 RepID=A0AB36K138_9GAMM|nr:MULTISPECIES: choline ABC transporter ATP-binding protein [Salinivibrio]OOE35940.1 choline ABC transporter ATP-binding protein [Salinivibrio kushneri]OOE41101.1 choline ABC transporter ATP-binding protein [Salinivibrio kushneri]OOE55668.1 choline ABC transporter ATP-binding protein [Salinivibrio kushneri]OOE61946.1 choline ABC transporter ATP-binding protein [Salinivibrio sp. IB282]OOE70955.1 choline ABC transporter ATP-binding protein [Salinivibrio kushneri]
MDAIAIKNLDVVFGDNVKPALDLLDNGLSRSEIIEKTGQVVGVDNVSLNVKEGEICVLMGLSGSGKSSLLRAVNGLNPISRGSLELRDDNRMVDMATVDSQTLRHLRTNRASMVFQKFALMPWLTVVDNVAFGLEMKGISKKERRRQALEKLEMVGLDDWAYQYPHELSGGMQQRVGLARAFAMDSDILLMDEPFSALDPLIRAQLQDELLELQKKLNKTILFVSHDLDEALKIGNNIAIMESGQLIQHGKPEDIVLRPETDYVRDFVAHTNPLNVLKGRSMMKSVDDLPHVDSRWKVCEQRDIWVTAEQGGRLSAAAGSQPLRVVEWQKDVQDLSQVGDDTIVVASPDIEMRDAIEIRYHTVKPVLLIEEGKLVGTLSDHDFYHALLGKFQQKCTDKAA